MNEIRETLTRMYKATKGLTTIVNGLEDIGISADPIADAQGDILEAIYTLLGEHTESFSDSVTYGAMGGIGFNPDRDVALLMKEYEKNHGNQPAPVITNPKEIGMMVEKNGGYKYSYTDKDGNDVPCTPDEMITHQATELVQYGADYMFLKDCLKEAGNELCYKCGNYRNEHNGACNGCRWRYVKHGEMPT